MAGLIKSRAEFNKDIKLADDLDLPMGPHTRVAKLIASKAAAHSITMRLGFLKLIAILLMIVDHIHLIWFHRQGVGPNGDFSPFLKELCYLVIPLFCVILIYNFIHNTKSKEKMLLRLGLFALLSQYPYYFAFNNHLISTGLNVLFTLFAGCYIIYLVDRSQSKQTYLIAGFAALALIVFEYLTQTRYLEILDGGLGSITLMLSVFLLFQPSLTTRALGFALCISSAWILHGTYFLWPLTAVFFALYCSRFIPFQLQFMRNKWFFYVFYPAHLFLIEGTRLLFMR